MPFSEAERTFLRGQRLARLAVVDGAGRPELVTAAFQVRGEDLLVGGPGLDRTPIAAALAVPRAAALLVEDRHGALPDRGVLVHGEALLEPGLAVPAVRVVAATVRSWGLSVPGGALPTPV